MAAKELYTTSLLNDANLIAYYRFNSGALTTDSKGSYTLTNNNTVGEGTGMFGVGADFGSSNSTKYFSRNDAVGLGQNKTVSLWVKLNQEITSGEWIFFQSYNTTDGRSHNISYQYNSGTRRLNFNGDKTDVAAQSFTYNVTLGTSLWHNIVFTFNGSVLKGYLDGYLVGSLNSTGNGSGAYLPLIGIGNSLSITDRSPYSNYSSCAIDDISIFSRALSDTEVATLYSNGDTIDFLVVAGGGSSPNSVSNVCSGGGGAGGLKHITSFPFISGVYPVVVGDGATVGNDNAGDSSFFHISTSGGGSGGGSGTGGNDGTGYSGGSGGGSAGSNKSAGTGISGQGNNGGIGAGTYGASVTLGGGGGGAGSAGSNSDGSVGGNGGSGYSCDITGSSIEYAKGGKGGSGSGGGSAGESNTGNGANANYRNQTGYAGGSGVVIIRYLTSKFTGIGGTVTTDGLYTVHTFTSSGDFEFKLKSNTGNFFAFF